MSGVTNLSQLLQEMSPLLHSEEYVFCSFPEAKYGDKSELRPVASLIESEGLSLVVPRNKADEFDIPYDEVMKMVTLQVHSSLQAVGLTSAFAAKLSEHGISANVVAGTFHDHIFVPAAKADSALAALGELQDSGF